MALAKPSPGLLPAENYRRFGVAFDQIDLALARASDAQAVSNGRLPTGTFDDYKNRVGQQFTALSAAIAGKQPGFDLDGLLATVSTLALASSVSALSDRVDLSATKAELSTEAAAREAAVYDVAAQSRSRPGDGPSTFARGLPPSVQPIPPSLVGIGNSGRVIRVVGADIISRRLRQALEIGRTYRGRFVLQRRANASDPSNDAVVVGLAWLDQAGNRTGATAILNTYNDLRTTDGRQQTTVTFGRSGVPGALVLAPVAAVYAVPYVQTYGPDGVTDIEVIDVVDATDLANLPDIAAGVATRVAALESVGAASRLDVLEQQIQNPSSRTFPTKSDAASGAIPPTVTTVDLLGLVTAGDGGGGLYVRASGPVPAGADTFTNDGAVFVRVFTSADALGALLKSLPTDLPPVADRAWMDGGFLAVS